MISNTAELIVFATTLSVFLFSRWKLIDDQSFKRSPWTTFFLSSSCLQNLKSIFLIASKVFKLFSFLKNLRILAEKYLKNLDDLSNFKVLVFWMNVCFNILQARKKVDHNFVKKSITFQVTKGIKKPVKLNNLISWQNGNFYLKSRFYTEISLA